MNDASSRLTAALSNSYRIERELGQGGMATVYLAEDLKHRRKVAIKVLKPDLAAVLGAERFLKEIETTASLRHPHILPLFDSGEAGKGGSGEAPIVFYVMPLVEGESLRDRLDREKQLPLNDALSIAREVADALGYAHGRGVIHRDIKPENILLEGGHATVADFGIARALSAAGAERLTRTGTSIGTPLYMSPEQAAGDPDLDGRSDLYSLGCVLFEMLAGQPPFTGPTAESVTRQHMITEAPPVTNLRPAVPPEIVGALSRLLAKNRADRFPQAASVLQALAGGSATAPTRPMPSLSRESPVRSALTATGMFLGGSAIVVGLLFLLRHLLGLPDWVVPAGVALLAIGFPIVLRAALQGTDARAMGPAGQIRSVRGALTAGGLAFLALGAATTLFLGLRAMGVGPFATLLTAGTIAERDRILVAEFANATPDSLLGSALTDALTIDLSQSPVVRLMTAAEIRDALARMKRSDSTVLTSEMAAEVAAREGVKLIVAGEIAPFASGYTVSARIIDPSGAALFATRATANTPTDIIPALETVSRKLREKMGESLRSIRAQSLEQVTTSSLEALQLYSRATRSKFVGEDSDQLSLYRQAVALDSTFAMAWRGVAATLINASGDPSAILEAVEQARRHKDRLPLREAILAEAAYHQIDGDKEAAIEQYGRLVALWPDDPAARNGLGLFQRSAGRYADAERTLSAGVEAKTVGASSYYNLATTQIPQGRFTEAERTLQLMRERFPSSTMQWQVTYFVKSAQHQFDSALAATDSLARAGDNFRYWGFRYRAEVEMLRGQLAAAERTNRTAIETLRARGNPGGALRDDLEATWSILKLSGDTGSAVARVQYALRATPFDSLPLASRPYGDLIRLYAALGRLDQARRLVSEYERLMPGPVRVGDGRFWRGRAQMALNEGKPEEALTLGRQAAKLGGCGGCLGDLLGRAHEQLGHIDSAIAAYEAALRPPVYGSDFKYLIEWEVPTVLFRVAELYEQQGRRPLARERYSSFVELWKDADPSLQPRVTEARARLTALAGEQ